MGLSKLVLSSWSSVHTAWKLSPLFGQELWDESIFYEVATKKCGFWCFVDFFPDVFGQIFVDFPIVESVLWRISNNIICLSFKRIAYLFLAESSMHCFVCKNVSIFYLSNNVIEILNMFFFWKQFENQIGQANCNRKS